MGDGFFTVLFIVCGAALVIGVIGDFIVAIFKAPETAKRKAEQEAALYVLRAKTNSMGANSNARSSISYNNSYSVNEYQLRRDLRDYYGTAAYNGFPAAAMDAINVDNMSTQELINQAQKNGFDMSKYTH